MRHLWTGLSLIASLVGVSLFGYSLTRQTQIQRQMNVTMTQLNQNVEETIPLVHQTSIALKPLVATTSALSAIETSEQQTVTNIATMNQHLKTIGDSETQVLAGMNHLFSATSTVGNQLVSAQKTSTGLLTASRQAVGGSSEEVGHLKTLNSDTADVIAQLHKLNQKLSALALVP